MAEFAEKDVFLDNGVLFQGREWVVIFYFKQGCEKMSFEELFKNISPRLKNIARSYKKRVSFANEDDLYQEMSAHLWDKFEDGMPEGLSYSYIVKGCKFFILNYLRKKRNKVMILSLETPLNDEGGKLGDIIPDDKEPLKTRIDRESTINDIKRNGLSAREKEVLSLLLKGYTVREAGKDLGISHVMVVKVKQRIVQKWRKKERVVVTKSL